MSTLPLLRGRSISLEEALIDDDNILHRLEYPQQQNDFWTYLFRRKRDLEDLVSFHLGVRSCEVMDQANWFSGSYNVCIPVQLPGEDCVLIRIPLPYKLGESNNPGNIDEKLRCEVATYIWIREHCPTVPIPTLYGFAFPEGQTFADPHRLSFFSRICWHIRRTLGFQSCPYVSMKRPSILPTGYMIISYVRKSRMLSDSWTTHMSDQTMRQNLFNDLAKIMVSLNRIQLPRIGSLTLDNHGLISLTNRPLTLELQTFENEGVPTISRTLTYESVEPYILDLLQCHDNRIHHQPNSIHSTKDGQEQFAALTMMRGLLPQFVSREYRHGPFQLTLTDLHPSNIFVDEEWHIISLIDLEWACSLPIELQTPPYWLCGRPVDGIEGEHLQVFERMVTEFIDTFEKQDFSPLQADIMRTCWKRRSFWYFQAVNTPKGLLRIFTEHIQRMFCEAHCTQSIFDRVVSPYWCVGTEDFIQKKLEEENKYKERLRERFDEPR